MFVSFIINTTGFTSEDETAYLSGVPEFKPVFNGLRFVQSLDSFYTVYFSWPLFFLSFIFTFWSLYHLSVFGLQFLITASRITKHFLLIIISCVNSCSVKNKYFENLSWFRVFILRIFTGIIVKHYSYKYVVSKIWCRVDRCQNTPNKIIKFV